MPSLLKDLWNLSLQAHAALRSGNSATQKEALAKLAGELENLVLLYKQDKGAS